MDATPIATKKVSDVVDRLNIMLERVSLVLFCDIGSGRDVFGVFV